MDQPQDRDIRQIELMTRWSLVMLQNAERGLVPLKALKRFVDPSVISAMGPIQPPPPGSPPFRPHVGGIRVHVVQDELAHVVCVASKVDGRAAGHVLEFRRDPDSHRWSITELTRVEERRLVSADERAHTRDHRCRYPADLSGLIAATARARADAEAALERAQAEAQRLRDEIASLGPGRSPRKARERTELKDKERAANLAVARWERALKNTERELRDLEEVRELREVRELVAEGDPLMSVRKPDHLERLLGPIPDDREDRRAWRKAASTIERYLQRWSPTGLEKALDDLPVDAKPEQKRDHRRASEAAKGYIVRSEHNREQTAGALELELGP